MDYWLIYQINSSFDFKLSSTRLHGWSVVAVDTDILRLCFATNCTGCAIARESQSKYLMVYNALHEMAPSYIKELCVLVTTNTSRSSLRSAIDGQLVVPKTSTKVGDCAFAVAGSQSWNKHPSYVWQSPSSQTFRRKSMKQRLMERQVEDVGGEV